MKDVGKSAYGNREKDKTLETVCLHRPEDIKGKDILLIDDVVTTGNSMSACHEILNKAGAKNVFCLALSRTSRTTS